MPLPFTIACHHTKTKPDHKLVTNNKTRLTTLKSSSDYHVGFSIKGEDEVDGEGGGPGKDLDLNLELDKNFRCYEGEGDNIMVRDCIKTDLSIPPASIRHRDYLSLT